MLFTMEKDFQVKREIDKHLTLSTAEILFRNSEFPRII